MELFARLCLPHPIEETVNDECFLLYYSSIVTWNFFSLHPVKLIIGFACMACSMPYSVWLFRFSFISIPSILSISFRRVCSLG